MNSTFIGMLFLNMLLFAVSLNILLGGKLFTEEKDESIFHNCSKGVLNCVYYLDVFFDKFVLSYFNVIFGGIGLIFSVFFSIGIIKTM